MMANIENFCKRNAQGIRYESDVFDSKNLIAFLKRYFVFVLSLAWEAL